jgi:putative NADH-flavin reductase
MKIFIVGFPTGKIVMKLLVIGATGRTGVEIIHQALARNHQVTAFVRSPELILIKNSGLTCLQGNVVDADQIALAAQNHDAILSALGSRAGFGPTSILRDAALATTQAMNRLGMRRLLVVSAAALFPGLPNRIVRLILKNQMQDSLAMEAIVQSSGLDWTITRPPRLTQGEATAYRSLEGAAPKMGFKLSRRSVAAFMLDAVEQKKHFQKIVGIAQ